MEGIEHIEQSLEGVGLIEYCKGYKEAHAGLNRSQLSLFGDSARVRLALRV